MVLGNTWVINPNAVNSIRFAYNRLTVNKTGSRFFSPEDVGIDQWTSVPDHFVLTVPGAFTLGSGPTAKREMWQNQLQFSNDFNMSIGTHQFALGGMLGASDVMSLAHTRGVGGITFPANTTGNALADFMLGRSPRSASRCRARSARPRTTSPSTPRTPGA